MKKPALLLASALVALVALFTAARAEDPEAVHISLAKASVAGHILPRYGQLAIAGERLADKAARYCAEATPAAFSALDGAFREYWLAWAGIRHIQFGPVSYLERAFRIQFWPDTRDRIGRQLRRTLAGADRAALAGKRFAGTSVAIQGLPALERLLAGGEAAYQGEKGDFRCALTIRIAENLSVMARNITADWRRDGGYAHLLMTAGARGNPYADAAEISIDLLQSMLAELEAGYGLRIGRPLGSGIDTARPKLAEAWRSGLSAGIMLASLRGIGDLYRTGGFDAALRHIGEAALADNIREGFRRTEAAIQALGMSVFAACTDPGGRRELQTIQAGMERLVGLVGTDLAIALEISPGFNARDGD